MSRPRLEDLTHETCWDLLRQHSVGRVAIAESRDGAPAIHPVNYVVEADVIVFHTASEAVVTAASSGRLAFEIDVLDLVHRTGWSVLTKGVCEVVLAGEHPSPSWAGVERAYVVRLRPDVLTGRWVHPGPDEEGDSRGYL